VDEHIQPIVQPQKSISQYSWTFSRFQLSDDITVFRGFGQTSQALDQNLLVPSMESDSRSVSGKSSGDSQPDPAARTGDQTGSIG
jgi:hypothetical protein